MQAYLGSLRTFGQQRLSREDELRLGDLARQGDLAARNELASSCLALVVKLAQRYASQRMPREDLIQEGNLGLLRAASKYDARLARFSTYAVWWIQQFMQRAIGSATLVRTPAWSCEVLRKIDKLERKLGREVVPEELAEQLQLSPARIRAALSVRLARSLVYSLDVQPAGSGVRSNDPACRGSAPDGRLIEADEQQQFHAKVTRLLGKLSLRQQEVVRLRMTGATAAASAQQLGISPERVRQLLSSADARLRRHVSLESHPARLEPAGR